MKPILTNIPVGVWSGWEEATRLVAPLEDTHGVSDPHQRPFSRIKAIKAAWKLFRERKSGVAFLVTANLTGFVLAGLLRVWPWGRLPLFFTATIWTHPRNSVERWVRRQMFSFIGPSIRRIFVHTRCEIRAFARTFGLPEEKFRFVPFCHRLSGYSYEVRDDGYVWSGGNGDRDYRTLLEAVENLEFPVVINSTRKKLFEGLSIPGHVRVEGVTPEKFRERMAACRVGVVPMEKGKLHPGGQQTFLALMALGKAVVVTDPEGARDYIDDGRDGFLVPPQDSRALYNVLRRLIAEPELRVAIGRRARNRALPLDEERRGRALLKALRGDLSD